MITIKNTNLKSDISLSSILSVLTKQKILKIIDRTGEYISPNLKKDETARRAAAIMLDYPQSVLDAISKTELPLVKEFIDAGPNAYVVKKARKSDYMLQKMGLVLTYVDYDNNQWSMLMPDEVREALAPLIDISIEEREHIGKTDIKTLRKQMRMFGAIGSLLK